MDFYVRLKNKKNSDTLKVYSVSVDPDDDTTLFLLYIPPYGNAKSGWYWLPANDYEPYPQIFPSIVEKYPEEHYSIGQSLFETIDFLSNTGPGDPGPQGEPGIDLTDIPTCYLCEELERRRDRVERIEVPPYVEYSIEIEADCDNRGIYKVDTGPASIFVIID